MNRTRKTMAIGLSAFVLTLLGGWTPLRADEDNNSYGMIDGGGATVSVEDTDPGPIAPASDGDTPAADNPSPDGGNGGRGSAISPASQAQVQKNIDCLKANLGDFQNTNITPTTFQWAMEAAADPNTTCENSQVETMTVKMVNHEEVEITKIVTTYGYTPQNVKGIGDAWDNTSPFMCNSSVSTQPYIINIPEATPGVPACMDPSVHGSLPWDEANAPLLLSAAVAQNANLAALKNSYDQGVAAGLTGYNLLMATTFPANVVKAMNLSQAQAKSFIIGHEAGHIALQGGGHLTAGQDRLDAAFLPTGAINSPDGFGFAMLAAEGASGVSSGLNALSATVLSTDMTFSSELGFAAIRNNPC